MPGTSAALRMLDDRANALLHVATFSRASVRHAVLALLYAGPVAGYETVVGTWDATVVTVLAVGAIVLATSAAAWRAPMVYRGLVGCLALVVTAAALMTVIYAIGLLLLPLAAALWVSAARLPTSP